MTIDQKRPWKELTGYDDYEAAVFSELHYLANSAERIAKALEALLRRQEGDMEVRR